MRKKRPFDSHAPGKCRMCDFERHDIKRERRRDRYKGKANLRLEFVSETSVST